MLHSHTPAPPWAHSLRPTFPEAPGALPTFLFSLTPVLGVGWVPSPPGLRESSAQQLSKAPLLPHPAGLVLDFHLLATAKPSPLGEIGMATVTGPLPAELRGSRRPQASSFTPLLAPYQVPVTAALKLFHSALARADPACLLRVVQGSSRVSSASPLRDLFSFSKGVDSFPFSPWKKGPFLLPLCSCPAHTLFTITIPFHLDSATPFRSSLWGGPRDAGG